MPPVFPTLRAVVLTAMLAGCGVSGPPVGPLPQAADLHGVALTGSMVLAAPAGWTPSPTLTTPVFAVAAPVLFAAMKESLLAAPRTWLTVSYPSGQAFFIVRSVLLNLPDIVVVQALPVTDHTSRAVILSQSRYDPLKYNLPLLGENDTRVRRLLAVLTDRFATVPPPIAAR